MKAPTNKAPIEEINFLQFDSFNTLSLLEYYLLSIEKKETANIDLDLLQATVINLTKQYKKDVYNLI